MKRTGKHLLAIFLSAMMLLTLAGCGGSGGETADTGSAPADSPADSGSGKTYTFAIGTVDAGDHAVNQASEKLGEYLEELAPGKFKIDVYPNSTLGSASELIESVQMGNVDIACPTASFTANFVPELGVLDLPYLFENEAQADAVLDGEVGQQLGALVNNIGVKFLTWYEVGFRCLANNVRAINSADDVSGLRLRIMSNEVHENLFSALGADPVPMGLSDALVANQQGTIDGMDNPLSGLWSTSVYEFNKYIAVTNHVYTVQTVIMSQKAWDSMDEADQATFMEAVRMATKFERETNRAQGEVAAANFLEKGCEVTYPDVSGFAAKMEPVYEKYPEFAELLAAIKGAAAEVQ